MARPGQLAQFQMRKLWYAHQGDGELSAGLQTVMYKGGEIAERVWLLARDENGLADLLAIIGKLQL